MELRHLRYFLSVAEHLNYSEASRRLHVAQPAISQTILDLEKELGVPLLLRTRRTVQLTAAGNSFLGEALEIVRRSESAKGVAQRAARGEIGALSIGYLPCTGSILPELIKTYRGCFPNVAIELHEMSHEQQLEAFDDKRINLGFSRSIPRERESEFNVELVYNDRLEIAMPSKHPLAKNKVIHLKDLATERFVEFHRQGAPGLFDEVIAVCRRAGFSPNIISEYDLMSSVMVFVESGLGVSVVPGCVRNLNNPGAILRPIKPASSRLPLCAIWSKSANAPVLDCFLEALRVTKAAIRKKMERPIAEPCRVIPFAVPTDARQMGESAALEGLVGAIPLPAPAGVLAGPKRGTGQIRDKEKGDEIGMGIADAGFEELTSGMP